MIIIKKIIGLACSLIVLTQLQAQTVQFNWLPVGGLIINSVYTTNMTGSFTENIPGTFNVNPIGYTVAGARFMDLHRAL